MEKILVLDFGGQYNRLIARHVREMNVYSEIIPYNKTSVADIAASGCKGIIFTGGPNSVYGENSPHFDSEILNAGIPVLGICYGCQLIAYMAGGEIRSAGGISEYGKTQLTVKINSLFTGVPEQSVCWMSHTDYVKTAPEGFEITAVTANCPCAALADEKRKIYGVQFHPEVTHTEYGRQILCNFVKNIFGCRGDWTS